jgi:hypothetical protein
MNPSAILPALLVVPLPVAVASYPRLGAFLSRGGKRLRFLAIGCALGLLGYGLEADRLVSIKVGLYFWAPLWQLALVQILYAAWFRVFKRPPVGVVLNWDTDILEDRLLAMAIGLLGILVPFFVIGR